MEKKLQKNASYILQIIDTTRFMARLPLIFLKKFRELNANADMMIKNTKLTELNISIATVFFNM